MQQEQTGLRPIGEILSETLSQLGLGKLSSELLTVEEYTKRSVARYNAKPGNLNETDSYNCPKCMNRGDTAKAVKRGDGWYEIYVECECMKVRRSIWRIQSSGLSKSIKEQQFKTFRVQSDWQRQMYDKARAYVSEGAAQGAWFYIGGQSGCGKSHICTAISRELLYSGRELLYVLWEQEVKRLKAIINEPEFADEMHKLEAVDTLYIDDLLKPITGDGGLMPPSAADLRILFQLINYRYVNKLPTIISSERYVSELIDLDEATGTRIYERAKGYTVSVKRDKARNQRNTDGLII